MYENVWSNVICTVTYYVLGLDVYGSIDFTLATDVSYQVCFCNNNIRLARLPSISRTSSHRPYHAVQQHPSPVRKVQGSVLVRVRHELVDLFHLQHTQLVAHPTTTGHHVPDHSQPLLKEDRMQIADALLEEDRVVKSRIIPSIVHDP